MVMFVWLMELLGGAELRSAPGTAGAPSAMTTGMRVKQQWCVGNSTSTTDKVGIPKYILNMIPNQKKIIAKFNTVFIRNHYSFI